MVEEEEVTGKEEVEEDTLSSNQSSFIWKSENLAVIERMTALPHWGCQVPGCRAFSSHRYR